MEWLVSAARRADSDRMVSKTVVQIPPNLAILTTTVPLSSVQTALNTKT